MKNLRRIKRVVTSYTKGLMSPEDKATLDALSASSDFGTISGNIVTYNNAKFDILSSTYTTGTYFTGIIGQFHILSATYSNISAIIPDPLTVNTLTASVYISGGVSTFTRLTASNLSASTGHFTHLSSTRQISANLDAGNLTAQTFIIDTGGDASISIFKSPDADESNSTILLPTGTFKHLTASISLTASIATISRLSSSNLTASTANFTHLSSSKHTSSYSTVQVLSASQANIISLTSSYGIFLNLLRSEDVQVDNNLVVGADFNSDTVTTEQISSSIGTIELLSGSIITGTVGQFLFLSATNHNIVSSVPDPLNITQLNTSFISADNGGDSALIITDGADVDNSNSFINLPTGTFTFLTATNSYATNAYIFSLESFVIVGTSISGTTISATTFTGTNSTFSKLSASGMTSSVGNFTHLSSSKHTSSYSTIALLSGSIITGTVGQFTSLSATHYNIPRVAHIQVSDPNGAAITTGDGKAYLTIPSQFNYYKLIEAHATAFTGSTSGTPTIQIRNVTAAVDMLSTAITIDIADNPATSYTAATPPVVDSSNNTVTQGQIISVDVDTAGTGVKGLMVLLTFRSP
jgi:hypothetical protein